MSELKDIGNMLMAIALQYTHPDFKDMHQDWKAVCDAGEELVEMDKEAELNDNQKIVLEYLKEDYLSFSGRYGLFFHIESIVSRIRTPKKVHKAYEVLDVKEEAQVLKAFAEWAEERSGDHEIKID